MLPAVKEMVKLPIKKSNVVNQLLNTPFKKIGDFYAYPVKATNPKKYDKSQASSIKSVAAAPSVSPTKKFSKSSNRTLTEVKILENLESEELEDKTPVNAKKASKTDVPAEKTITKVDNKSKIPVKASSTKSYKAKPPKVDSKEPAAKTTKIKKSPKKETKSESLLTPHLKTPKKPARVSLTNLPPGSPLLDSILKDVKKVEVRLTPMKIKEDPNVVCDLLESKFKVQKVVDEIVKMKKEVSPQTRLNGLKDESVAEVPQAEKSTRTNPTRKFVSMIQPASLLEEITNEPHPLESVEATLIRGPSDAEPMSPEPMMVTGELAKMCSIM